MENNIVDHLFRHEFGKMVSVLTRIFGLAHLETIEDAVQDTFIKAMQSWRKEMPDNPKAWLMKAAKNRTIDLFRKIKADNKRESNIQSGTSSIAIDHMFMEHEIADSQLRMLFTACNPVLNPKEQIIFALKSISGFSIKEIASALLLKQETVKKRLARARKSISEKQIRFEIPIGHDLPDRLNQLLQIIYLIFNEGFHSNKKEILIRKDLCSEAIRLNNLLLENNFTNHPDVHALLALFCFQSSRLESKVNENNELIDLKHQDRKTWFKPLIVLGNQHLNKAVENTTSFSSYHYEAAIAGEHVMAPTFVQTNWKKIINHYNNLYKLQQSEIVLLNIALIYLQQNNSKKCLSILKKIQVDKLEQRKYLYFGTYAEYFILMDNKIKAIDYLEKAINLVQNENERNYLIKKKESLLGISHK